MNIFRYLLSILIISGIVVVSLNAQDYYMASPIGFGRNATGGQGGTIVTVNDRESLKQALKSSTDPKIIIITENIEFGENQMINEVIKNKTLLGLRGVKLIGTARVKNGGVLGLKEGSNNVIIRNLIFEGQGAFDVDGQDLLQNTGCTNFWVDHCEFYDGVDGNFDNTKKADNITISWCKFGYQYPSKTEGMTGDGSGEHRYSNLVGGSASDYPADGHYSITFQYCYWGDGCAQRMPRARNAELHLLNCYYNITDVSNPLAIGLGAGTNGTTCYVEGTNFKKVGRVVDTSYDPVSGQSVAVNFLNCLNAGANSGIVSKPSYTYTAIDVDIVEAVVTSTCGAGATLDVTLTGEISSPSSCAPLSVPGNVNATATSNSVTVSWGAVEEPTEYRVKLCYDNDIDNTSDVIKEWNFSAWTIDADNADANLVLDENNPARFNYKPATNDEELTSADGMVIPDVEGLKFTAGSDTRLRLGFGTGLLYLNGSGIKVKIPCSAGNYITIKGTSSNITATNRGFSVSGGTIDSYATSDNIINGILTEAGGTGTWVYIATSDAVTITTLTGGMNLTEITISSEAPPVSTLCNEYDVDGSETSKTITGLTEGIEYTYQVKAIRDGLETAYSNAQTIVTANSTSVNNTEKNNWQVLQSADKLIVNGLDVEEMSLYNLTGHRILNVFVSQELNISYLPTGVYILSVKTKDSLNKTRKIIKY